VPAVPDVPPVAHAAVPPSAVELLERAISYTRASLQEVTGADLTRSTPCAGWLLGDLLRHLDDSLAAIAEAAQATTLTLVPAPAPVADLVLLDSICHRARGLLGHWHPPRDGWVDLGEHHLRREVLGAVGALEITLHGWDVAQSLGHPRRIPPALADDLWTVARDHITEADRPHRFGPAVGGLPWASPQARLLGHAGRHPDDAPRL
jgi:uncharacterized protein (TIGR03086 family)